MKAYRRVLERYFSEIGVRINGHEPWDLQVNDERFYKRALWGGSLGFGETYVDGWWSCVDLEELVYRIIFSGMRDKVRFAPSSLLLGFTALMTNQQSMSASKRVAARHYDLGNDLFFEFLGDQKNYSCGYFWETDDLDRAQLQKMDLVCRKLDLQPSDLVLDVGGGWGELARYGAENYGCHVTSINISDEQIRFAKNYCKGGSVDIVKADYRELKGSYDKIAVIAMLPHVGFKNYRTFMNKMRTLLKPDGLILIETVGGNFSRKHTEPWIDKYIFPGGMIPSVKQIAEAIEGLFVLEDLHNFAPSYVKTLRSWNANFLRAWPRLEDEYGESTRRMFEYFFLSVAGAFRARNLQYWHLLMTVPGRPQPSVCRLA